MESFLHAVNYSIIKRQEFYFRETTHPDWTLYIVIDGGFCCEFDGKQEQLEKGDLYFIPPSTHFKRHVTKELKVHFFRFQAQAPLPFPLPTGKIKILDSSRLQSTLQMLARVSALPLEERELHVRHLLCDILFQYRCESTGAAQLHAISDPTVVAVLQYLKQSYAQKLNMREVAERFGLSPSGLILKFRRTTGQLPMRHLIGIRIDRAKRLLADTSLSLSEIAEQTGFENCYYFSNSFKRETGLSPSVYRKTYTI